MRSLEARSRVTGLKVAGVLGEQGSAWADSGPCHPHIVWVRVCFPGDPIQVFQLLLSPCRPTRVLGSLPSSGDAVQCVWPKVLFPSPLCFTFALQSVLAQPWPQCRPWNALAMSGPHLCVAPRSKTCMSQRPPLSAPPGPGNADCPWRGNRGLPGGCAAGGGRKEGGHRLGDTHAHTHRLLLP